MRCPHTRATTERAPGDQRDLLVQILADLQAYQAMYIRGRPHPLAEKIQTALDGVRDWQRQLDTPGPILTPEKKETQ